MERTAPTRYADIHAKREVPLDSKRLLTDRSAYISFLEVQLERVTASCLTVQGFADRIEQLQGQVTTSEEKIANLTRQLTQQSGTADRLLQLEAKVAALERVRPGEAIAWDASSMSGFQEMYKNLEQRIRETDVWSTEVMSKVCTAEQTCNRLADDALAAVEKLTTKVAGASASAEDHARRLDAVELRVERFGEDLLTSGRDALLEERVSKRLQDGLQQMNGVLRRVVDSQRAIRQHLEPGERVADRVRGSREGPVRSSREGPVRSDGADDDDVVRVRSPDVRGTGEAMRLTTRVEPGSLSATRASTERLRSPARESREEAVTAGPRPRAEERAAPRAAAGDSLTPGVPTGRRARASSPAMPGPRQVSRDRDAKRRGAIDQLYWELALLEEEEKNSRRARGR